MIYVLIVLVVVLLAIVGALVYQRRRSAQLQQGFGPEYDRTVEQHGDQRAAESELRERRERRRRFDIRPLNAVARDRYAERWRTTQSQFVDQPASALEDADTLVAEVMRERGYPVEDFEQRAADVSVDHPTVVEHYRKAHAIHTRSRASTEDLREAMLHYRALFAELLESPRETQEVS
ncbi:hypothetical protein [Solirubrobacter soli]|uniref:hypothetical protein n=1 Tax=Solirubrobacter soli TaxID=363832 RepID=UPI00041A322E|nr:hypothetical protein [Solirubrobacter soli]